MGKWDGEKTGFAASVLSDFLILSSKIETILKVNKNVRNQSQRFSVFRTKYWQETFWQDLVKYNTF